MGDPLPCVRIGESKRYVVVQRFCPFKRSRMPVTPLVFAVTISPVPAGLPEYDRRNWKHWTDADGDCQDARNEVLIAESATSVTFRTNDQWRVASGERLTPYASTAVTDPSKLDVDHMVPLGNAHISGAWQWPAERKERYANYLDDPQHLIAATASANRSKGARGPDQWKPDDRSYWCQYAVDWASIKSTWGLTVTEHEFNALNQMLNTCQYPNPPALMPVRGERDAGPPGSTSTPVPPQTPTPAGGTYPSCDAAQAAGEARVSGSQGPGRGFPKLWYPAPETAMETALSANDRRPTARPWQPSHRTL